MVTKPVLVSQQSVIASFKALGFSDDIVETPRRLIVSSSGREKTGKSTFALTGPPPIIYFNIDIGTEGVVGKFQESGKQVLVYDVRVKRTDAQANYVPLWLDLKQKMEKVYTSGLKSGTVVVDTATEMYELARLAKFGKLTEVMPQHYTEVKNEMREVLRLAYDSTLNTVFVHKMKPKYIKSQRTGEYELSGMDDMDYLSQVNLEHMREDTENGTVFSIFVKDCRQNTKIAGQMMRGLPLLDGNRLVDPLCNFDMLLNWVHGVAKK